MFALLAACGRPGEPTIVDESTETETEAETETSASESETGLVCEDPQPETCATAIDDDCDGSALCDPAETFAWSSVLGSEGWSQATALDVAPDGTIWVGGELDGTIVIAGQPITALANRGRNLFVARLDPAGAGLSGQAFVGFDDAALIDLAVDGQGRAALLGTFSGGLDLGGGVLDGPEFPDQQVFLAGYDPLGQPRFSQTWIGSRDAGALAIGVDDELVITGRATPGLDLGGGPLAHTSFVAAFDALGQHRWSRSFELGSPAGLRGLDVDDEGSIVVLADYAALQIELDGFALDGDGSDLVLARFDPEGVVIAAERIACDMCRAHDLRVLVGGDILIAARFATRLTIADQTLDHPASARSIGFARLDPDGVPRWLIGIPDADSGRHARVSADASGGASLVLDMAGAHDLGGGLLSTPGPGLNAFVLDWTAQGEYRWSQRYGGVDPLEVTAIVTDDQGGLLLTGLANGTIDFGGGEQLLDSPPGKAYVARLLPPA
ncbi:hypothetical protein ACNOYE_38690 [Nannocystaceae bacterium ST9]